MLEKMSNTLERTGNLLVDLFHMIALFVIGATVVWSAVQE
jgi:hypothetical protein